MLIGSEQLEWREALFKAFSEEEFRDLLLRLDDDIGQYSSTKTASKTAIGDVVAAYSRRDLEDLLIAKAVEARPRNSTLLKLASTKKAAAAPNATDLERLVRETTAYIDPEIWLQKAGKLQVCVCRIEIALLTGGKIYGTGFLIAPDLVMTNYHVVECVAAREDNSRSYVGPLARAEDVVCRFDYKVLANGMVNEGSSFRIAQNWRVILSPNGPRGRDPEVGELDCAVIRLAEPVGDLSVGDKPDAKGDRRGWIDLPDPDTVPEFKPQSPMFIIQHPEGKPLKFVLETSAVLGVNPNRTRVRYATNTEPGSSGSPCFDQNWNIVALHHSGDPNFTAGHIPEFNEGIPIDAIVRLIEQKGLKVGPVGVGQ